MHSIRQGEYGFSHNGSHLMLLTNIINAAKDLCPHARNLEFWASIIQKVKDTYFAGKLLRGPNVQMTEKEMKICMATLILMQKEFIRLSGAAALQTFTSSTLILLDFFVSVRHDEQAKSFVNSTTGPKHSRLSK